MGVYQAVQILHLGGGQQVLGHEHGVQAGGRVVGGYLLVLVQRGTEGLVLHCLVIKVRGSNLSFILSEDFNKNHFLLEKWSKWKLFDKDKFDKIFLKV